MVPSADSNLERLQARGVVIPHPHHVIVEDDVRLESIERGATLLPGTRLSGAATCVGQGAVLGSDGPVTVRNTAIGRGVVLASGVFDGTVFLDGASFGPSGQARGGTIFEEGASAAHAVGVKQTILLPWATLGSNVNFCDALLAGGRSRTDHSEIGSGFIHFNYTPYGPAGDKATASLFGDVVRGTWMRENRIFLGGAGGVVGPVRVGFGTVLAAGSVFRKDRNSDRLVYAEPLPPKERSFDSALLRRTPERVRRSLNYIAQLVALRAVYWHLRIPHAADDVFQAQLYRSAVKAIDAGIAERLKQIERLIAGAVEGQQTLRAMLGDHDPEVLEVDNIVKAWATHKETVGEVAAKVAEGFAPPGIVDEGMQQSLDYPKAIQALSADAVEAGIDWLEEVSAVWRGHDAVTSCYSQGKCR